MVRGHAKAAAQEKNAKKQQELKKKGSSNLNASPNLKFICAICKVEARSYKMMTDHYDSKHPKEAYPPPPG